MGKIKKGIPSHDRTTKIDAIIALKILTRDNIIYESFEERCKEEDNVAYLFSGECQRRDHVLRNVLRNGVMSESFKRINGIFVEQKISNKLEDIDKDLYQYLNDLFIKATKKIFNKSGYTSTIVAEAYVIKKALGKERFDEWAETQSPPHITNPIVFSRDGRVTYLGLRDDDMCKIKEFVNKWHFGFQTIVKRNYADAEFKYGYNRIKNNNVYVELDLSKPFDELTTFIKTLKNDFDTTDNIRTIYNLVDDKNTNTSFDSKLHKYNIYKKNNRASKTNIQLLADVLFIYDCIIAEYDLGSIKAELDNYYQPVQIEEKVLSAYYDFAYDFIDNQTYLDFISGFSTSSE